MDLYNVQTDLDKLIYTMKTVHKATKPKQFPQFWNEEWLEAAIKELDTRAMTPEKRMAYEMTISANALAIRNEQRRIEEVKIVAIQKALRSQKLTVEEIADFVDVSVEFVLSVQQNLS